MLYLDIGDLNPPGIGLGVEYMLNVGIELVTLCEHLVEFMFAEHRTQSGLDELTGRRHIILNLDGRLFRIDHAEIDHCVDPNGDVVARDHVLGRHVEYQGAQVDRSEEHTSELQSLMRISYAVFCLTKKKITIPR